MSQSEQERNPDARLAISDSSDHKTLAVFASSYKGIATGDLPRFIHRFWEVEKLDERWSPLQESPKGTGDFTAYSGSVLWERGNGQLHNFVATRLGSDGVGAWIRGEPAWGKQGIAVAQIGSLSVSLFSGALFDESTGVLIPKQSSQLPAIWAYVSSPQYPEDVRKIDRSLKVPTLTLLKVAFDLAHWQSVAADRFPNGLPAPYSDDPTQWLFHGHPAFAEPGTELHVALARLCGYTWPAETDATIRLSRLGQERIAHTAALTIADADGLLPLYASGSSHSLADRLRTLLAACHNVSLSLAQEQTLVRAADARLDKKEARDATLEGWLADRAFRQHCVLFDQRPFLWHVWDGSKDGFSAFLNYHRLDRAVLDKLAYTILGDWIRTAKAEGNTARCERGEQLRQKLTTIAEGENPFDLFVRWKPLSRQPLGWVPDLDDGVRLNIRPFVIAGILREQPKAISWNKDRGTDVPSAPWYDLGPQYDGKPGDRINDHHTTLAEKRAARGTS